jgi:ligand-binding SRPBCC domain-containing protein
MPRFQETLLFSRPVAEVFDFLARPANLLRANPPELQMEIIEAPESLRQGSRMILLAKRFGMSHRLVSEVIVFQLNVLMVDEQREGPFRKWVQTSRFDPDGDGTRVCYQVDYEPPGGLLGFVMTAAAIDRELQSIFTYRAGKLKQMIDRA